MSEVKRADRWLTKVSAHLFKIFISVDELIIFLTNSWRLTFEIKALVRNVTLKLQFIGL